MQELLSIREGLVNKTESEEKFKNRIVIGLNDLDESTAEYLYNFNYRYDNDITIRAYKIYAQLMGLDPELMEENLNNFNVINIIKDMKITNIIDYLDILLENQNFSKALGIDPNKYGMCIRIDEDAINKVRTCWIDKINTILAQSLVQYKFDAYLDSMVVIFDEYTNMNINKAAENIFKYSEFEYASKEFEQAYIYLSKNEYENCILNIAKALESVLKVICINKGFTTDNNRNFKCYFEMLKNNNFLVDINMLDNNLTNLMNSIQSGLPTIRNKTAGHGQGSVEHIQSKALTEFAFTSGISAINLLISLYKGGGITK